MKYKIFWMLGVITSDHKPVWGMFEVGIRPGKDSVPLAGGLFNRLEQALKSFGSRNRSDIFETDRMPEAKTQREKVKIPP